mmetsp:Transcript_25350/g.57669  ORF Transcript_25350/g.57669 Transcript_25350/m.57669 type:complete len:86 (+) Transcript_25350:257-514(+)
MPQYNKLMLALTERFGEKVRLVGNDPEALAEFTETGKYRPGAFEVIDLRTKDVLYTKLGTGLHVTEKKEWMDRFLDDVAKKCGVE